MTAPSKPATTCTGCPCALTKDGSRCGYKALRGDERCLRENTQRHVERGRWFYDIIEKAD